MISSRKADACHEVAAASRRPAATPMSFLHIAPRSRRWSRAPRSITAKSISSLQRRGQSVLRPLLDIRTRPSTRSWAVTSGNIWLCAGDPQWPNAATAGGDHLLHRRLARFTVIAPTVSRRLICAVPQPRRRMGPKGVRVNCVAPGLARPISPRRCGKIRKTQTPHHTGTPLRDRRARRNRRRWRISPPMRRLS